MSVITYSAKREIEPTGYSKTGTDLSVAAADDSFNSVSTSLLGLANDEWIKAAGFANAVNNGWFQANAASTAVKITQDTTTALVTEAAGPQVSIVGYKRGAGQQYSIEFTPRKLERRARVKREQHVALGGSSETIRHRRDVYWDIVTGRVLEAQLAQWREFLASVEAEETFTIDLYGTIAVPGTQIFEAVLDSDDYSEDRLGAIQRYTIGFRLRLL